MTTDVSASDPLPRGLRRSASRLVGLSGLVGLLLLLSGLLVLGLDLQAAARRDAERDLASAAYLLADHAGRLFEVADVAIRGAAAATEGLGWDEVSRSEALWRQLKATATSLPYVEDVWLNDASGELRLTTYAFPTPRSNAADREVFRALRDGLDRPHVGERIVGRVTGRPTFLLSRRLVNPDGTFRGMASVTADLAYFGEYWGRVRLPPGARVTVFREGSFDVLAQHPPPPDGASFVPAPARVLRDALARAPREGQIGFASATGGGARLAAYRRVGDLPLLLTVSSSEVAIEVAWRARMRNYLLLGAAAAFALAFLTLFAFRQARQEMAATRALEEARDALARTIAGLETKVAERTAEVRASEGRFRTVVESATDYAIIATDLAGTITLWNAGARNILGWEAAEALGRSVRVIFTPEDGAGGAPEAEMGHALANGRAADERWHVRRDGSRFFASGALLPIRAGENGAPTGFLKILRDRTEAHEVEQARRDLAETLERLVAERTADLAAANDRLVAEAAARERAEEQLRQAQKMEAVGRLTGGVAHDFNNLLTVVMGNLAMLRRRLDGTADERVARLIAGATEGANRAAALTFRLLAFSRQQPLAPEPVDANKLVAGMSDLLRRTLGENIAIETVLAGGLWRTHADPNGLENAVLNLAVNARDAMPDGGKLTVETANAHLDEAYAATRPEVTPGQYVLIAVCDTGMGMTPEVVAQAFEPFFTTKPVGKGTGLGLSQVYGFVKQSGGHAAIYSEPGHGTTFKLYLPRFRQAAEALDGGAAPARVRPIAHPARGRGETVLVVEDEVMVREFSVAALEEAGYRVLAAEDGPSGLALLDAHPEVALLFTDVVLTGPMNGRKVADEALRRRPELRILFTTGYTRNAIIHHGRLDEGVDLLTKPFAAEVLTGRVRTILDRG